MSDASFYSSIFYLIEICHHLFGKPKLFIVVYSLKAKTLLDFVYGKTVVQYVLSFYFRYCQIFHRYDLFWICETASHFFIICGTPSHILQFATFTSIPKIRYVPLAYPNGNSVILLQIYIKFCDNHYNLRCFL